MKWSLKQHGDPLEREAADFVAQNIPAYEETWGRYIGHQGNGHMVSMNIALTQEEERTRREFSQHHYTILESLFLMQRSCDQEQVHAVKNFEDYRVAVNNIMVFQAHAGRLRDNFSKCFEIMYNSVKAGECQDKLEEFYTGRHIFMHGKKVPFSQDEDGLMKVPQLKTSKLDPQGYGSDMLWEDATWVKFQYTADYMRNTMTALCKVSQGLLQQLLNEVKKLISDNQWTLQSPSLFNFNLPNTLASGSTGSTTVATSLLTSALSSSAQNYSEGFATSGVVNSPQLSNYRNNVKPHKAKNRGGKKRK